MSELAYLGMALVVSVVASLVFLRSQRRPQSLESGVQQFSRGINALASASTRTVTTSKEGGAATRK